MAKLPKILLVDMNSFFASVEQQALPQLRGRPVGVCASLHETSCLIAASKEAKALGIKTGTLIFQAKRICPGIVLLRADPPKYREVNRRLNAILSGYTDRIEPYSIDESFLDLSDSRINPLQAGAEIKERIKSEIGEWLTCSVGVAENKFMAKLAADLKKPDGLTIIWRENLPEIYRDKKLSDLWGVARGWERRLARLGITSPGQLLGYPVQNLVSLFGKPGFYLWERVNGLEKDCLGAAEEEQFGHAKSFGNSWVLNFRSRDKDRIAPVILRLAEKASRRMRSDRFVARAVGCAITLKDGLFFHKTKTLPYVVDTGEALYQQVLEFWKNWSFESDAVHVSVRFSQLCPKRDQLSLFPVPRAGLTECLDKINDKYGEFTIRSALLANTEDYAPDAIAFGK